MLKIGKIIPYVFTLSMAGWEMYVGIIQLFGLADSLHSQQRLTGTFYNSGPYACYLAVAFPIVLRWAVIASNKFQKLCGMGMVILAAILIPATLSRTACVACVIGCCMAFTDKIHDKCKNWDKIRLCTILLFVTMITIGAYLIKKESADGRFLIWKVATLAAMKTPASGVGWNNVAGAYGKAQEVYFASGNGSVAEKLVADAPAYVFNEYLQVAIAYGIPVAIAMTAMLIGGIIVAVRNKSYGLSGSAVAVAVVMTASYPLQFPLFVITIGLILMGCYLSSDNRLINFLGSIVVITECALFLNHNSSVDVQSEFNIGHSLHKMREYRKSNDMLLSLMAHSSDPMILNIIGKNYQSLGIPDSAEHFLMKSVNRCPNRFYPHYLLMNLYSDTASYNRTKMIREAEIIINKKEKIHSPAIDEMRQKAQEILAQDTTT